MPDTGILVVNSDMTLLKLLRELLTEEGFEASICLTNDGTYEHILQTQPNLIILDVGFQASAAGWPLLKLLHLDPHTMRIPVLITTVDHQFIADKADFLAARGYDVLELPASFEELLAKTRKLMCSPEGGHTIHTAG
jgi:DNA-binding response OmpR family regulator